MRRNIHVLLMIIVLVFLSGCAGSTAFSPYPSRIAPLKQNLLNGRPTPETKILSADALGPDKIVNGLERGRYFQLIGRNEDSRAVFSETIEAIHAQDRKAIVSVSRIGANLAAFAVNDNLLPYEAEGYERILLHHYQTVNYLLQRNLEGAAVEIRWANSEQESALKRHEDEVDEVSKRSHREPIGNPLEQNAFRQQYAQLDEAVGSVKNSFQNPATFFLSGLVYQLQGLLDDAYIDYRKALEIRPDNRYLQQEVLSLATQLDRSEDRVELEQRFPSPENREISAAELTGKVVILYEENFVPVRNEVKLAFATPGGIVTLALPFYQDRGAASVPLRIDTGQGIIETVALCDVRMLAIKSLRERIGKLVVRQLIRAVTKAQAQKIAREKLGPLGEFATSIYSLVSENADLRSWTTLPEDIQLAQIQLSPGERLIKFYGPDGAYDEAKVPIKRGGTTIIIVSRFDRAFRLSQVVY